MSTDENAIALQGAVWMTVGGAHLGGSGRVELLAAIAACGSITQAAKAVKMSYKAAWDAIDAMNNLAGVALVERLAGGKGGGGTRLTRRGLQLVENFRLIEREHQRFVQQLGQQAEGIADDLLLIRRMALRTTARNQFMGRVARVRQGAVNDEIELALAGGQKLVAIVTRESSEGLGLVPGAPAYALVKASSIILVGGDGGGARYSARNQMAGRVARLQDGAVNSEVVLDLPGGATIAAIITKASCAELGLRVGAEARALFKASSVILGVPA
ncbi:TOBE domain-containing protein [Janthinobacterium sp.]|uniref:TOBE domain-containing protein n=1 Tax=Janthinobacterium sp. TaxID=1871054 RepID=UPI00293D40BF|nr:TOBE domain-containing protein [Janthinobacterium sp.]